MLEIRKGHLQRHKHSLSCQIAAVEGGAYHIICMLMFIKNIIFLVNTGGFEYLLDEICRIVEEVNYFWCPIHLLYVSLAIKTM